MAKKHSYKQAGVDIDAADAAKEAFARSLQTADSRVLNRIGAYASMFDGRFPEYESPVLILKIEEPGSKQKLAFQHGRARSICYDLINHLVNDISVMGARPLAVLDAVICGKLDREVAAQVVDALSCACREQDCVLVGGETSEQPGVLEQGTYVLVASIVGVAEKAKILDGSKVRAGDAVLAVASNGLHTNGYSLVRALIADQPAILEARVDGEPFLEAILRPHMCYYQALRGLFDLPALHGMAHITGSGIGGNLPRVIPPGLGAVVDLSAIRILPVFKIIRQWGRVDDRDMLRTFNLGVGLTIVADRAAIPSIQEHLAGKGSESYLIGEVVESAQEIAFRGQLRW